MGDPPEEIRLKDHGRLLEITYGAGETYALSAEYLRVESPSAEVKGHGPGQEVTVAGKRNVRILRLAPVGHYALRIVFDDRHDSGLYTWSYLRELGRDEKTRWSAYLQKLAAGKLTR
ncbi:MAG: gamma-butyrobetaine hydroxylase-like domain-containing protein [Parvibaculaceae bacterium]